MNKLYTEIPLSIFVSGLIIYLLAGLPLFYLQTAHSDFLLTFVPLEPAMQVVGLTTELIGIIAGLYIIDRHLTSQSKKQ